MSTPQPGFDTFFNAVMSSPVLIFLLLIIFVLVILYFSHVQKQKYIFQSEIQKVENIRLEFIKSDKYKQILLLQSYYNQIIYLESFGIRDLNKSRMQTFQKYYRECESFLHDFDPKKWEHQKYFLAFADIQSLLNQTNISFTKEHEDRFSLLPCLIGDMVIKDDNRYKGAIGCGLILTWFSIGFFPSDVQYILVNLCISFALIAGCIDYVQRFQREDMKGAHIRLENKIRLLKNVSILFTSSVEVLRLLIQSEQGVKGIEPIMVDKISFYINRVIKQWDEYDSTINTILHLVDKRLYLLLPKYPFAEIGLIINNEREKGRQDFLSIQATIKSWITTHIKDLQNHQQEIHQIHQLLLQNKNENAEVITLLEKNFNLHLQSAQKVENSI